MCLENGYLKTHLRNIPGTVIKYKYTVWNSIKFKYKYTVFAFVSVFANTYVFDQALSAASVKCHYCENTYHTKCISLETDYIRQLKENWLYGSCITDIFPFNKLENEDDFRQEILMKLENELIIWNLIYNPHESNSFDFSYCDEFDPDANFFCQQNIFSGYHAHITQKMG